MPYSMFDPSFQAANLNLGAPTQPYQNRQMLPTMLPGVPASMPAETPTGMTAMNWVPLLAAIGKAFAPHNYNRWGAEIPSWQGGLADAATQFSQGQLKAKALNAPMTDKDGFISPQLFLQYLGQQNAGGK